MTTTFDNLVCMKCGNGDNEDVLMICEGCFRGMHTFCGVGAVPEGSFFCLECCSNVPQSWKDTPPPTDILDDYVKCFTVCHNKKVAVSNMRVFLSILDKGLYTITTQCAVTRSYPITMRCAVTRLYPITTQCAVTRLLFAICQENWDNLMATHGKFAISVYKKILEFESHYHEEVRAMIKEFAPLKERLRTLPVPISILL